MTARTTSEVQDFLDRFFGKGNRFGLAAIESGEGKSDRIRPWIARLTLSEPLPTVLPRWVGDQVYWYGIAQNERQFRRLSEELVAFVGPTWSDFRGQRAHLDTADPVEAAVLEWTNGAAFKISGDPVAVWNAIERMRVVWEQRVDEVYEAPRPTGRVLRDFYMAVRAGNRDLAERELRYLQEQYRLDALNLLFLRIHLLSELGHWDELLSLSELTWVIQARRPQAVTRALIKAIYWKELVGFEEQDKPASAVAYFHQAVLPKYGNLFAARAGAKEPEVIKSFMLLSVGGESPKPELRDELLGLPGLAEEDHSYLERLAPILPPTPSRAVEEPWLQAQRAARNGYYDQAFALALESEASPQRVRLLFECAYELQTLEVERAALEAFDGLSDRERESFLAMRWNREFLSQLAGAKQDQAEITISVEAVPNDWVEWLIRLQADPSWARALEIARQGATEWHLAGLVERPEALKQMGELLASLPGEAELTLHHALPFLLAFFQKDEAWPRRECLSLYSTLLDVLVLSTSGGESDLTLFNDLNVALLTLGIDAKKYEELLGYARDLWETYASPSKTDWVLDLLDSLIIYPCPSEGARTQLLFSAANKLRAFVRRLEEGQKEFFMLLVQDLHQEEALHDLLAQLAPTDEVIKSNGGDALDRLADKTVAIYTLTEAVGERVKKILESHCEGVRVHLSHDKVGTDRLRQLAKNADVFVMATMSAKHAATGFIEAHRPKHLPLLLPDGRGSASMLRALRSFAQTQTRRSL